MNRSKVEEQRENTWLFKGEIGPKNRGQLTRSWERFDGVVGAIPLGRIVASILRRIGPDLAVNWPQISLKRSRSHHDGATIALRSAHDRVLIVILGLIRSPSDPVEAIPR